jgi:hypothetical protein
MKGKLLHDSPVLDLADIDNIESSAFKQLNMHMLQAALLLGNFFLSFGGVGGKQLCALFIVGG